METETAAEPKSIQERALSNRYLAQSLRIKLRARFGVGTRAYNILEKLSDEELIRHHIANGRKS